MGLPFVCRFMTPPPYRGGVIKRQTRSKYTCFYYTCESYSKIVAILLPNSPFIFFLYPNHLVVIVVCLFCSQYFFSQFFVILYFKMRGLARYLFLYEFQYFFLWGEQPERNSLIRHPSILSRLITFPA